MDILYPVFLLVALTVCVGLRLGYLRYSYASRGKSDPGYYVAYYGEEPLPVRIVSRHYTNLLETPLLFYIACVVAYITQLTGMLVVSLAWAYVVARLVHTGIHLGSNIVIRRFQAFAVSALILVALWITLFVGYVSR